MMSQDLQVYKDSYNLFHKALDINEILPKVLKYTIGQQMIDNATTMMKEIEKANCAYYDKSLRLNHINEARTALRLLDLNVRLCFERRSINPGLNADYAKISNTVGKQLTGWANSVK